MCPMSMQRTAHGCKRRSYTWTCRTVALIAWLEMIEWSWRWHAWEYLEAPDVLCTTKCAASSIIVHRSKAAAIDATPLATTHTEGNASSRLAYWGAVLVVVGAREPLGAYLLEIAGSPAPVFSSFTNSFSNVQRWKASPHWGVWCCPVF